MALVPNGRLRLMVAQTMGRNDPNNFGAGNVTGKAEPQEQPAPRNNIQQEEIGDEPANAGVAPVGLQDAPEPEMGDNKDVAKEGNPPLGNGQKERAAETSLKDAWKAMMLKLGVEERQIEKGGTELFSQEIDLSQHNVSGFYMIPTHTQKETINEQKAQQIAHAIGQKFGLDQKLKLYRPKSRGSTNWRVDFRSIQQNQVEEFGNSFDGIGSDGGGPGNTSNLQAGNSGQKQASWVPTMGEMLKARRELLYQTMRKRS